MKKNDLIIHKNGEIKRENRHIGPIIRFFLLTLQCNNYIQRGKMEAKKILFVTQEINPYVPESPITDMGRKVPLKAIDMGREIRAFMPKWGNINERRNQLHEVIRLSGMNLIIDNTDHPLIIKVASLTGTRMQVYFIDNEDYFAKRLEECDPKGKEYKDNMERAVFYARGVLETGKKLRWVPDIIHCQGWISSIIPSYLRSAYADEPSFRNCKIVYSPTANKLTLSSGDNFASAFEFRTASREFFKEFGESITPLQLEKLAIKYADGVAFPMADPNPELLEYAKDVKKPILTGNKILPENYLKFFDDVCSNGNCEPNGKD